MSAIASNSLHFAGIVAGMATLLMTVVNPSAAQSRPSAAPNKSTVPPYDGPPIYLDEPEVIAKPTFVRRERIPPEKYADGKIRIEREVAHYSDYHVEADGIYREYYPNGQLFVEGQYQRGRQHGEWTFYFDDGKINRKSTYNNGQPDGAWDVFRADGTLSAKRSFKNGVRDGEWITYDETGKKPLREEHYLNGKADGVWKVWFPSGKLKQQAGFKEGMRHGATLEWNENGEKTIEINYADNKLEGKAMQRLSDGRTVTQEYKAGKLISQSKK
jgi:antitoxin component YwqK of YwqJK toxin-antitoxin module